MHVLWPRQNAGVQVKSAKYFLSNESKKYRSLYFIKSLKRGKSGTKDYTCAFAWRLGLI